MQTGSVRRQGVFSGREKSGRQKGLVVEMEFAAIAGVVVVAAFLAVLLRQKSPEQSMAVGLLTGVGVMALLLTKAAPSLDAVKELMASSALPAEYGQILFKALGICLLTQLAADACRDAGESALAGKAELAGKVGLIMLSLPLFQKIAELAVSLMNGEAVG